jgi:hypothetical protein
MWVKDFQGSFISAVIDIIRGTAMSIVLCTVSTKGGVGKTTLTANSKAWDLSTGQKI